MFSLRLLSSGRNVRYPAQTFRSLMTTSALKSDAATTTATSPITESPAPTEKSSKPETFAHMLRHSKFVQIGDPAGKVVVGKVYHVVDDDLYIDFGGKFPCVCQKPHRGAHLYTRGTEVRLLVKKLELSQKFLGYEKEMSLLEADCVLLGLANPRRSRKL